MDSSDFKYIWNPGHPGIIFSTRRQSKSFQPNIVLSTIWGKLRIGRTRPESFIVRFPFWFSFDRNHSHNVHKYWDIMDKGTAKGDYHQVQSIKPRWHDKKEKDEKVPWMECSHFYFYHDHPLEKFQAGVLLSFFVEGSGHFKRGYLALKANFLSDAWDHRSLTSSSSKLRLRYSSEEANSLLLECKINKKHLNLSHLNSL